MSSIDDQVAMLKARIENAQRLRARAEADQEAAQTAAQTARNKLLSEYNVTSVDDAKKLLGIMQEELNQLVRQTQQSLNELNL